MLRIEYKAVPGDEVGDWTVYSGTTLADMLSMLPGEVIVRPATPFEAVCDRIHHAMKWQPIVGSVLLPALRPPAPECD